MVIECDRFYVFVAGQDPEAAVGVAVRHRALLSQISQDRPGIRSELRGVMIEVDRSPLGGGHAGPGSSGFVDQRNSRSAFP